MLQMVVLQLQSRRRMGMSSDSVFSFCFWLEKKVPRSRPHFKSTVSMWVMVWNHISCTNTMCMKGLHSSGSNWLLVYVLDVSDEMWDCRTKSIGVDTWSSTKDFMHWHCRWQGKQENILAYLQIIELCKAHAVASVYATSVTNIV